MAEQVNEVKLVGYIRKQAWDDVIQRQQIRLYTGVLVYNLPYLFAEPQEDNHEWLEVEVTLIVKQT